MEHINKGDSYDKIVKNMKLKDKHDIYIAVSRNRKNLKMKNQQKQLNQQKPIDPSTNEKAETEEEKPASKNLPEYSTEITEMRSEIDNLNKIIITLTGDSGKPLSFPASEPKRSEEKMEITVEPSMKQIGTWVYAKNQLLYDFARAGSFDGALKNFRGNWSDFVNLVLEAYFKDKFNAGVGLLSRRFAP